MFDDEEGGTTTDCKKTNSTTVTAVAWNKWREVNIKKIS